MTLRTLLGAMTVTTFVGLSAGSAHAAQHATPARASHMAPPASATRHTDMVYVTLDRSTVKAKLGDVAPPPGYGFLTMWLRVTDRNDVQKAFGIADLKVLTEDGTALAVAGQTPEPAMASSVFVLNPGQSAYGSVTFVTPLGQRHVYLQWSPAPTFAAEQWAPAKWTVRY